MHDEGQMYAAAPDTADFRLKTLDFGLPSWPSPEPGWLASGKNPPDRDDILSDAVEVKRFWPRFGSARDLTAARGLSKPRSWELALQIPLGFFQPRMLGSAVCSLSEPVLSHLVTGVNPA